MVCTAGLYRDVGAPREGVELTQKAETQDAISADVPLPPALRLFVLFEEQDRPARARGEVCSGLTDISMARNGRASRQEPELMLGGLTPSQDAELCTTRNQQISTVYSGIVLRTSGTFHTDG